MISGIVPIARESPESRFADRVVVGAVHLFDHPAALPGVHADRDKAEGNSPQRSE